MAPSDYEEYVEFRKRYPEASFIEWVDPADADATLAGSSFVQFAQDPDGSPIVFYAEHVALLDRAAGEGEWLAENFREFLFHALAEAAQFDDEPVAIYADLFTAEQNEFLASLPLEDTDQFDELVARQTPWWTTQADFEWTPRG